MKKTRSGFKKIWDLKISSLVNASFDKFESELKEHGKLMKWTLKHVLLPVAVLYLIVGLIIQKRVVDSLFIGFLLFIYSGFVPDLDSLMVVKKDLKREDWVEKIALLFLGPLLVYYLISGESKPIYVKKTKEFHSVAYLAAYCTFLLAVGLILYGNALETLSLPLFGGLGYATHLFMDGYLKF